MEGLIEGRMVHFVDGQLMHRAAVITKVWNDDGMVNLYVFPDASYPLDNNTPTSVEFRDEGLDTNNVWANTWHWIEKA